MISLIGIGEAGCNVVSLFENHREYNCFLFSEDQENTKYTRKLSKVEKAEDCEGKAPKLSSYKTEEAIQDRVTLMDNVKVGEDVEVFFNLKGREWTNKQGEKQYFNTLQLWKVNALGAAEAGQATPAYAPPVDISAAPGEDDDLPF